MNLLEIFDKIDKKELSTSVDDRVLIIDSLNSFLRCWSTMPEISENGYHAGGIVGFLRSIGVNIRDFNPTRCILVFDGKGGSQRRRKIYPDYKAHRKVSSKIKRDEFASEEDERESFKNQLMRIVQYLEHLPVQVLSIENIEADDTIAYIASNYFTDHSNKIRIVSTDRDFLQLISDKVEVYSPVKKKLYNRETFMAEYGILPENYLLFRTIDGDKSDNISKINGIGIKTMKSNFDLLESKLSIDELLGQCEAKNAKVKSPKKIFNKLLENRHIIERNYDLMQLHDVEISGDSKLRIIDTLQQPITQLDKHKLKKFIIEDYLTEHFKNFDNWINMTFNSLVVWTTKAH